MSEACEQETVCMSTAELERTMRELSPMYDIVRVVDPSVTQGRTLDEAGELNMPHRCYDALSKERRCDHCISARTVSCHNSVSKFEFVGDDAYYISTRYVEVDGQPRSIELIRKISDDLLFPASDSNAKQARSYLESDASRRYSDTITKAYNKRYLDEGISDLRGDELALLHVSGVEQLGHQGGWEARDAVLSTIADSVLSSIRNVDTLVRSDDTTFVIIFEGIPRNLFDTRLRQIRKSALRALEDCMVATNIDLTMGAVIQEGSLQELMARASKALEQALTRAQPVILLRDEMTDPARAITMPNGTGNSSQGDADKPSPELIPLSATGTQPNMIDALTGLPQPAVFRVQLQVLIDKQAEDSAPLKVIHVDIENFKAYNRAYGLQEGDLLLTNVAAALRQEFPEDLITRSGVDMFNVATRTDGVNDHIHVLRKLVHGLSRDVAIDLKAGVCEVAQDNITATIAMDRAKIACNRIKGKYDRSVRYFDGHLEHDLHLRDYIVRSLDTAIEHGYIQPYYQGIVRSFTGDLCSLEALSRWIDPAHGMISPAKVIPTLERHHLIHKHDIHIIDCVCRDMRTSYDVGGCVAPVSVNLSRLDFELCNIFEEVEAIVERYRIPRSMLGIEITESALDTSNSYFRPQVERFREAGYEVWMDDFGSGYSSLNLLKDYEFDVLKIDMAFLKGFDENESSKEILRSIVDMAKRLGIRTLAEGVETKAQFDFLRNIGCEMIQGYLFYKPCAYAELNLGATRHVETSSERKFMDSIGRVNMLSQEPTETMHLRDTSLGMRGMPLALLEWDGDKLRFFTANEAYVRRIHNEGFGSVDDIQNWFNNNELLSSRFVNVAESLGADKPEQVISYPMGKATHSATLQFVAHGEHSDAYLFAPFIATAQ
ncbi:MAG: GGDEF domain-containing phosphodiesterase [Coriobacteriales bacterium]|nr:GGDEF domain-containing phosphodiesterase [Coriobacteriales bacterium]